MSRFSDSLYLSTRPGISRGTLDFSVRSYNGRMSSLFLSVTFFRTRRGLSPQQGHSLTSFVGGVSLCSSSEELSGVLSTKISACSVDILVCLDVRVARCTSLSLTIVIVTLFVPTELDTTGVVAEPAIFVVFHSRMGCFLCLSCVLPYVRGRDNIGGSTLRGLLHAIPWVGLIGA